MGLCLLTPACLVLFGVSATQLLRPGGSVGACIPGAQSSWVTLCPWEVKKPGLNAINSSSPEILSSGSSNHSLFVASTKKLL